MVDNSQEYRLQYCATRSSVRSFAYTAHLFACSGLLASLAASFALTRSFAESELSWAILSVFLSIFDHSEMLICHQIVVSLQHLFPYLSPVLQFGVRTHFNTLIFICLSLTLSI